jgi:hypothetical protein
MIGPQRYLKMSLVLIEENDHRTLFKISYTMKGHSQFCES